MTAQNKGGASVSLPSLTTLRKRVVTLCAEQKISQMALSRRMGKSSSYLSQIWHGGSTQINEKAIGDMSRILGEDLLPYWKAPERPAGSFPTEDAPEQASTAQQAPEASLAATEAAVEVEEVGAPESPVVIEAANVTVIAAPEAVAAPTNAIEALLAAQGRQSTIRVVRITVTPQIAAEMLKANRQNRNLSRQTILYYARQITNGQWNPDSGEMIKFTPEGELIDGQHRLQSIIVAGQPIDIDVAYGVPKTAQATIDTGRARSVADHLTLTGESSGKQLAAAVRWVFAIAQNQTTYKASTTEVQDFLRAHPEIRDSVRLVKKKTARGGTPSLLLAIHFIAAKCLGEPEKAAQFMNVFITGEPNYKGDPVFRAREIYRDAREKGQNVSQPTQLRNLIHAWNLFRKGAVVKSIRTPSVTAIDGFDPKALGISPSPIGALKTTHRDGAKILEQA